MMLIIIVYDEQTERLTPPRMAPTSALSDLGHAATVAASFAPSPPASAVASTSRAAVFAAAPSPAATSTRAAGDAHVHLDGRDAAHDREARPERADERAQRLEPRRGRRRARAVAARERRRLFEQRRGLRRRAAWNSGLHVRSSSASAAINRPA